MARRLIVEIVGDSRSLERTLKRAGAETKTFGSRVGGMAKTAALAGGAAGVGALVFGLRAGIKEFAEAARVSAQTEAVIKSTGGVAGVTAKQVDSLAAALMRKSGVDDEAIKSGQNLLLTFTNIRNVGSDRIFDEATRSALDMSVALGQDMTSSAIQLGKALNDPIKGITALRRVGVSFTEAQREQIKALVNTGHVLDAQKLILRELNVEFGGSAEAAGKTLPGRLNILRESFKNLIAQAITPLLPLFERLVGWLQRQVDWLQNSESAHEKLRAAAAKVKEITSGLLGVVRDMIPVLKGMWEWITRVADAVGGWTNAFKIILAGTLLTKIAMVTAALGPGKGGLLAAVLAIPGAIPIVVTLVGIGAALYALERLGALTGAGGSGGAVEQKLRENGYTDSQIAALRSGKTVDQVGPPGKPSKVVQATTPNVSTGLERVTGRGVGAQVPTSFTDTHGGRGLPALGGSSAHHAPMVDIGFNTGGGVVIGSPNEITVVTRLSGRDPALGGTAGGAYGFSVYLSSATADYYITHLAKVYVKPGQKLAPGTPIGYTANAAVTGAAASSSHAHVERSAKTAQVPLPPVDAAPAATPPGGPGTTKPTVPKSAITQLPPALRIEVAKAERIKGIAGLRAQLAAQRSVLRLYADRLKGATGGDKADLEEARTAVLATIDSITAEIVKRDSEAADKIIKRTAEQTAKIHASQEALITKLKTQVSGQRDSVASAFGSVLDKALQLFDAKTQAILGKAFAHVKEFEFYIGVGDETPAEKALAEFDKKREEEERARRRAEAQASGDAERIRELDIEDERRALAERAKAEREAADKALADRTKELEDERALQRQHFELAYQELIGKIQRGELSATEGQKRLAGLLKKYDVDFADAGQTLGQAFSESFSLAMQTAIASVQRLIDKIAELKAMSGVTISRQGPEGRPIPVAGYAMGVRNAPAGLAMVGENGPELLRMRGGESVVPLGRSNGAAGGSGGGWPEVVQLVVDSQVVGQISRREAQRTARRNGLPLPY